MKRHSRLLFLAVLCALLAPFESTHAFIFLRGNQYQKGERPTSAAPVWPARTVSFVVNTNLSAMGGSLALPISAAELFQSVEAGVNAWAAACRADLRVTVAGTTTATYNSSDEINVIQWDNRTTGEGNYYGTSTSTLAAATTVLSGSDFLDCDIVLNGNATTTMTYSPALGEADLRSVLTHEIGHCLGLDHPIEPPDYTSVDPFLTDATMVQTAATGLDPSDSSRRDIAQDDRDGIECLYERGKPLRQGLHCDSYTGTNGQGALTGVVVGGPTVTDTGCGGDAQGRNTNPSLDSGDGCISSAVARTTTEKKPPSSPLRRLGGSFGFFACILLLFVVRNYRRMWLVLLFTICGTIPSAFALDLELKAIYHRIDPTVWTAFGGMDPEATAWDRSPTSVKLESLTEIRATAFSEYDDWGKWGGALTFTLPTQLSTNAKALNAAEQAKKTTLSGIRIGPEFRFFLNSNPSVRWFLGGHFDLGILYGSQTFSNDSESSVSYRAWSTELALQTGVEIPLGDFSLVAEVGYARLRSSYFASTGNSGTGYSDFPSGTRLTTNTGMGREDLRFTGSGFYAALGLQMVFGEGAKESRVEPRFDDYEKPVAAPTPEQTPVEAHPALEPPAITPIPAPPSSAPTQPWEIDPIPSDSLIPPSTVEGFDSSVTDPLIPTPIAPPPSNPDPVPFLQPHGRDPR